MTNLYERIKQADDAQSRIEGWSFEWRFRAFTSHEKLFAKLLHRTNLLTQCCQCYNVQDDSVRPVKCEACGSSDTVSSYYC